MLLHVCLRVGTLISVAALFVAQQISHPLITVWVAIGEYLHCASYVLLLDLICSNRGLRGLSVKTQICFLFVHWFRYVDSFFHTHPNQWIASLKAFYMVVSAMLVLSLVFLRSTWERNKDTCSLGVLLCISIFLGSINFLVDNNWPEAASERTFHYFWILSHYLQGFAMLPQFVFCYRDPENKDSTLTAYILVLGSYRLAYAINWIERAYKESFFYISGPLGLGILVIFLGDFLLYKFRKRSCISSFVLRIDDTIAVSPQPLLQAVYGSSYERISLADLSRSARVPPIEIDLQHVHVIGRPYSDTNTLTGTSNVARTTAPPPVSITPTGALGRGNSTFLQQMSRRFGVPAGAAGVAGKKSSLSTSDNTAWIDGEWPERTAPERKSAGGLYKLDDAEGSDDEEFEEAMDTKAAAAAAALAAYGPSPYRSSHLPSVIMYEGEPPPSSTEPTKYGNASAAAFDAATVAEGDTSTAPTPNAVPTTV